MTCSVIKLAVFAPPLSGHLYPVLGLMQPLLDNPNYDITVYTGLTKVPVVQALGFKCQALLPDQPDVFDNIASTDTKLNASTLYGQIQAAITMCQDLMTQVETILRETQPDVATVDFVFAPLGMVCDKLGLPWLTTNPTPFSIESKTDAPAFLGGLKPPSNWRQALRNRLGRGAVHGFKRLVYGLFVKKALKRFDPVIYQQFKLYRENGEEGFYSPYGILALGMEELEFRKDFPAHLTWLGPTYPKKPVSDFQLPTDLPTVLVTNGTLLPWGKESLLTIVKRLAQAHPDICFLVTAGSEARQDQPVEAIMDNVYRYQYIDYEAVLPHVDYVIHHGGAGILYASIRHGKPALVIPHDYDQFDYAARLEWADAALVASLKRPDSIEAGFNQLLSRTDWTAMKTLQDQLLAYPTQERLEAAIARVLK